MDCYFMFSISQKALYSFREVHTFALFLFTLAACLLLAGSRTLIVFDSLAVNVSCLSLLLAVWPGYRCGFFGASVHTLWNACEFISLHYESFMAHLLAQCASAEHVVYCV